MPICGICGNNGCADAITNDDLSNLTGTVIGAAYAVHNTLGPGFAERVYENALAHELRKIGIGVEQQVPITVYYDGIVVGEFVADIVVEGQLLLELKAVRTLDPAHVAQCINYLTATGKPLCLLLNFGGPKVDIKRLAGKSLLEQP